MNTTALTSPTHAAGRPVAIGDALRELRGALVHLQLALTAALRRDTAGGLSRRVRDAAAVRALAMQYAESDPGFASDLRAAADRHDDVAD